MDFFERLTRIRRGIGVLILLALLFLIAVCIPMANDDLWSLLFSLLSVLFIILAGVRGAAYRRFYKSHLVQVLLHDGFDDLIYREKEGVSSDDWDASGLLPTDTLCRVGDFVSGRYKGLPFRQSDLTLMQRRGKHTVTLFSGRFLVVETASPFSCRLQIMEKSFVCPQKPVGQGKQLDRLYLDDEAFHRFFSVYTDDREKGAYILTPALRQAILQMNYDIVGDLLIAFQPNAIYFALNGVRDSFEPPVLKKLNRKSLEKEVLSDIRVITAFLDTFLTGDLGIGEGDAGENS